MIQKNNDRYSDSKSVEDKGEVLISLIDPGLGLQ